MASGFAMGLSLRCGGVRWLCVEIFKWIPVLLIAGIISWSYFAFVVHLCFLTIRRIRGWVAVFCLLPPYHIIFALFVWSYWKIIFTPPGSVPSRFRLTSSEMEDIESAEDPKQCLEQLSIEKDLSVFTRSPQGEVRYCTECRHIKPDRTHHCSVCGQCVLKMDHHCPWVNNCVAFANYKYFVLFLGYAVLYCVFVASCTLEFFLAYWNDPSSIGKFQVLFLFFASVMFCLSVTSLFSYHLYLVFRNLTTLESFRPPIFRYGCKGDKRGFHLGFCVNFQEVFGDSKILWFLPVFTSLGDGVIFPRRMEWSNDDIEMIKGCSLPASRHIRRPRTCDRERLEEELLPMIQSVSLDDEEESNGVCWIDSQNQLTMRAGTGRISSGESGTSSGGGGDNDRSVAVLNIETETIMKPNEFSHTRSNCVKVAVPDDGVHVLKRRDKDYL